MRMYVSGIEDENPDWYDLVTNDGDEERVREVAEAAAEAVAAAGTDANVVSLLCVLKRGPALKPLMTLCVRGRN